MKISTRIVALVLGGFLVTVAVTGVAIMTMSRVADRLTSVTREELPLLGILTSVTVNQLEQAVSFEKSLRLADVPPSPSRGGLSDFDAQTNRFAVLGTRIEDQLHIAISMAQRTLRQRGDPRIQEEFRALIESLHEIRLSHNRYGGTAQRIFFMLESGDRAGAERLLPSIAIEQKNLTSWVEQLVRQVEGVATTSAAAALEQERSNVFLMVAVGGLGLVACLFLGLALGRNITRPITQVVVALAELVRGNIDVPLDFKRIPGEVGAIAVALRAFRDEIVTRRKTVIALAESERRFHSLAQVSPVGIFYTDPMGNCRYSNDKCAEITGLSETGMLGTGWQDTIHPEDRHRVLATWEACAAEGKAFTIEYRFLRRNGVVSWVIGQTTSHKDGEGRVTGFVSTLTDITEQKSAEQTLRHYARARGHLQDITVDQTLTLDEKIHRLLILGTQAFHLPLGIVSRVDGDSYIIEHIVGPEGAPPPGAIFSLSETYCVHTLAANGPVGFDRAGESHIRDHPCYRLFRLESYIGVPMMVDGRRYGTLNFSGPEARERPFGESDYSLIQLFAQWIGAEISRRHSEDALRISEERLKLALEGTEDGLWDWNVATGDAYFSPRWEAMLGFDAGETEPRISSWEARVHPQDKPLVTAAMNAHLQGRTPVYEAEYRLQAKNGKWLYVLDRGKVVERRHDGTAVRAVGTHTDITARKRAEDALRDSEERVRVVVDTMVDGIITLDESGVIESVNPAVERIFGYPQADLVGRKVHMLMPDPQPRPDMHTIEDFIRSGRGPSVGSGREISGLRKDGTVIPLEIGISEMTLGGRRMYAGIVRDITERKQIERMKSEFVSTVSHELRTPLTSIRGALGLLAGGAVGALPTKIDELVDIAYKNSQRLITLVNDILDLEKIESGRMEFRFQPTDIGRVVRAAIDANAAFAKEFGVEFVLLPPVPAATVNIDSDRIIQVMANLLSNAAKFSPSGRPVEISIAGADGMVRVAVRDHGPGIPDGFRDRIFQRFSQADSSDTRKAGGTGLGLSISKTIVERHAGRIGFDSRAGDGTTFYFDLPVVAGTPAVAEAPAPPSPPGRRARVLICEDNPDIAKLLAMLLDQDGVDTEIAPSAEAAETLLSEHRFDAMTVDVVLPGKDGISLIRDVRLNAATRDLPVIVISARAESARHELDASALGVLDWLNKPLDEGRLRRAVKTAASGNRQRPPRLLYVEDDADLVATVRALLGETVDLTVASTVKAARKCLRQERFDLAILDVGMPDGSGLDLLKLLKGNAEETTPVIIFSGEDVGGEVARKVDAALIKARDSHQSLINTIRQLIDGGMTHQDSERSRP